MYFYIATYVLKFTVSRKVGIIIYKGFINEDFGICEMYKLLSSSVCMML